MTFMLMMSCFTGLAGSVMTTTWLPQGLHYRGIQCAVFTAILQGAFLLVTPLDRDVTGMVPGMVFMLVQFHSPFVAVRARRLVRQYGILSRVWHRVMMYALCMVMTTCCWLLLRIILR